MNREISIGETLSILKRWKASSTNLKIGFTGPLYRAQLEGTVLVLDDRMLVVGDGHSHLEILVRDARCFLASPEDFPGGKELMVGAEIDSMLRVLFPDGHIALLWAIRPHN